MKTSKKRRDRVMSLLLTAVLCLGFFVAIPQKAEQAGAIYHADNAPGASLELLQSTEDTFAATPGGAMLRVIDGELWVWGSNVQYGTGLANYNGVATTGNTVIPSPVKHDYQFDGKIVKVVASCSSGVTVLTDQGSLYSWGSVFHEYVFAKKAGVSADGGRTPVKWDTSLVEGTIVDMYSSSLAVSVVDDLGNWYTAGSLNSGYSVGNMTDGTTDDIMKLKPLAEWFIDRLQKSYDNNYTPAEGEDVHARVRTESERLGGADRRTVVKVIPTYGGGSCFVIARDPDGTETLFSLGHNNHGQNFQPDVLNEDGSVKEHGRSNVPVDVFASEQNKALVDAGPRLETLNTEGHNTSIIDAAGNVWMVGDNAASLYPKGVNYRRPQKVYDAQMNGAKAVKVYQASQVAVFLTEDNSLYAIGQNANQFIDLMVGAGVAITDYTQVFTALSQSQTITGVYPTDKGVMAVTKSGEQYWAGDNSGGTAGNGTTDSPEPGQIEESVPDSIPPPTSP